MRNRGVRARSRRVAIFVVSFGATVALSGCDTTWSAARTFFDDTTVQALDVADDSTFAGYELLEENLDGVEVLFTGEAHGNVASTRLALTTARYLSESGRPTTLLWETGFAAGVYLDRYVTGGDESILHGILQASEGTYLSTKEWRDFYQNVRSHNGGRPADEQIRIIGIDVEHQHERGFTLMQELLPDSGTPPAEIAETVASLARWSSAATYNDDEALSLEISSSLEDHSSRWDAYLGATYAPFRTTALAVQSKFLSYAAGRDEFAATREAAIEEIFVQADAWHRARTAPAAPFYYAHWGRVHVRLNRVDDIDWIAGRINALPAYSDAVLAVHPVYHRSYALRRAPYHVAPLADPPPDVGLLARHAQGTVTLFDLDAPGSPFLTALELVPSPNAGGATTDYYQMAILVTGSRASTPVE